MSSVHGMADLGPPNHSSKSRSQLWSGLPVMWQPFEVHGVMPPSVCIVPLSFSLIMCEVGISDVEHQ